MKRQLWLFGLVALAVGLGVAYFLMRPDPGSAPVPAAKSSTASVPKKVKTPKTLPPRVLSAQRLSKKGLGLPSAPKESSTGVPSEVVDISGKFPLPNGQALLHFKDPQGHFEVALPAGWKPTLAKERRMGMHFSAVPPDDPSGKVFAAIYVTRVPPVKRDSVIAKLVEAVHMRGETLVRAQRVKDGPLVGMEIVSELPGPPRQVQRSFYIDYRRSVLQLLVRAPKDEFSKWEGLFYAMARSLRPGPAQTKR